MKEMLVKQAILYSRVHYVISDHKISKLIKNIRHSTKNYFDLPGAIKPIRQI